MYPGQSSASQPSAAASGGPDGPALTNGVNGHLDYVSQLAGQLGVTDPVESYLTPAIGTWNDLHTEAGRWRAAASTATQVTSTLTRPLGGLDAAWQGQDANSFLDYMQRIGLAGNDLADAMNAMADALAKTADGLRSIVKELVDLLTDTAEQASDAMSVPVSGEARARQYLDELTQPSSQLYESVRDVLDAFVRMCNGVQGSGATGPITMSHTMPASAWAPSAPAGRSSGQSATERPIDITGNTAPAGTAATPAAPAAPATPAAPVTPAAPAAQPAAAAAPAGADTGTAAPAPAAAHAGSAGTAGLSGSASGGVPGGGDAISASHEPTQAGAVAGAVQQPDPSATQGQDSGHAGAAAGADGAAGAQSGEQGQSGMPGMSGMGGMRGGQGGGDQEHKSKIRISGDIRDIFGKPDKTTPPVIGEE
ncbi:MAG TPA: WXG100 family type VII secretion target [Pseudonocardiaceae bacterium]|nr:WXG100 family type VII secretion target [Pseudonocardiaceae bacterium]